MAKGLFIPARFDVEQARRDLAAIKASAKTTGEQIRTEFQKAGDTGGKAYGQGVESALRGQAPGIGRRAGREIGGAATSELGSAGESGGRTMGEGVVRGLSRMRGAIAAAVASAAAIVVGMFTRAAIQAGLEWSEAWDRLAFAVRQSGEDFDAVAPKIRAAAEAAERLTGVRQEEQFAALTTLVQRTNDYERSLAGLGVALDLAAAKKISLERAADIVADALNGETGALREFGIEITASGDALEQLAARVGGAAESLNPLQRGVNRVKAEWRDLLTTFGLAIIGASDAGEGFNKLADILDRASDAVERNAETIGTLTRAVVGLANVLGTVLAFALRLTTSLTLGAGSGFARLEAVAASAAAGIREFFAAGAERVGADSLAERLRREAAAIRQHEREMRELADRLDQQSQRILRGGSAGPDPEAPRTLSDVFGAPPRSGAPRTRGRVDRTEEQLARQREALQRRLADQLAALTTTAVDEALIQLERFEAEWIEAFGRMDDATAAAFAEIRANIASIGREEFFRGALEQIEQQHIETAEQAAAAIGDVRDLADAIAEEAESVTDGSEARERYNKLLKDAEGLQVRLAKVAAEEAEELKRRDKDNEDAQEERIRRLREQARTIEENVRAALQLAEAFGLIGEEAGRALQDVATLASSVARLAGGDASAIVPAIGSLVSLIGGLSGESESDRRRREILERNTQALERLRIELQGFAITGNVLDRAKIATVDLLKDPLRRNVGEAEVLESFRRQGFTRGELQRLADEFGITLFGEDGKVAINSLKAFNDALEQSIGAITGFRDTLEDRRFERELEANIFDEEAGPAADLKRELELLREFMPTAFDRLLEGADPTTAEGRRQIEDAIRQLFREFQGMSLGLEGLSREQFLDMLRRLEGSLDALAESPGAEGSTTAWQVTRSITEVTAHRLHGTLTTIDYRIMTTNDILGRIYAELSGRPLSIPTSLGASVAQTHTSSVVHTGMQFGDLNFSIELAIGAGATEGQARRIGSAAGDAAAEAFIDRALGRQELARRRAEGHPFA
jgi:hypothetical protein